MINGRILAVSLAACMCVACGDGGGGPSAVEDYFPLETGSTWEFEAQGYCMLDTVELGVTGSLEVAVGDSVTLEDSLAALQVELEAVTIYDIEGVWADTAVELRTFYWRESAGEILQYDSPDDTTALIIHSPPIEVGRVWYPGPDEPAGSYEVESVTESADVPFGTYENCAWIRHENPAAGIESFARHAPGVGIVQMDVFIEGDSLGGHIEYDLVYTNNR